MRSPVRRAFMHIELLVAIAIIAILIALLLPYRPGLNPIETVFFRFKHLLRSAAERTLDAH